MPTPTPKVVVTLRVDPASLTAVDRYAALRGWSRSRWLRQLIQRGLDAEAARHHQ